MAVSKEIAAQLNAKQVSENEAPSKEGVSSELAAKLQQREKNLADDSFGATAKDSLVGAIQGLGYDWTDDILESLGDSSLSEAYELALQRSPYATIGSNVAGSIGTDVALYSAAGSVVPGVGTAGGAVLGGITGAGKAATKARSLLSKLNQMHKQKNLIKRSAGFAGIGGVHGAVAGAGMAEDYGQTRGEVALIIGIEKSVNTALPLVVGLATPAAP